MKRKLCLCIIGLIPLVSGCATIMSGETQKINVTSSGKPNVKFEVDGQTAETPAVISVKREKKDKVIIVKDETCNQKKVVLPKKLNNMFLGNLLSGGVWGSTTDYITGAMWEYDSSVNIYCE